MTNLKPCPHCGETQYLDIQAHGIFIVVCNNPKCPSVNWYDTEAEAIQSWNTRHTPSLSDEAILVLAGEYGVGVCAWGEFISVDEMDVCIRERNILLDFARAVLARTTGGS